MATGGNKIRKEGDVAQNDEGFRLTRIGIPQIQYFKDFILIYETSDTELKPKRNHPLVYNTQEK